MIKLKVVCIVVLTGIFSSTWGSWNVVKIGVCPDWCYQLKVGKGRNDGTNRVYVSGYDGHIYEWTYINGSWACVDLGAGAQRMIGITIGDSKSDGVTRVYDANENGYLYEFTYNPPWTKVQLPSPQGSNAAVAIGNGRNDGVNRVYASCQDDHIYELTYSLENWERLDICPHAPFAYRWDLCLGRIRSDGLIRVYSTAAFGGGIREQTWASNSWVDSLVDAVTGASTDINIGPGRNDDTFRIYAGRIDGSVYEITNTDPWVGVESISFIIGYRLEQNRPNPFSRVTEIEFQVPDNSQTGIKIYNLTGRLLRIIVCNELGPGTHRVIWYGKDNFGNRVAPGVYFYRLYGKSFSVVKKLIVI
ncbi:MAG: T9SS type A sorting domain-containing protein [bacterium]|nr:T9SS type A sorting domain-containing protein [bacterium]